MWFEIWNMKYEKDWCYELAPSSYPFNLIRVNIFKILWEFSRKSLQKRPKWFFLHSQFLPQASIPTGSFYKHNPFQMIFSNREHIKECQHLIFAFSCSFLMQSIRVWKKNSHQTVWIWIEIFVCAKPRGCVQIIDGTTWKS